MTITDKCTYGECGLGHKIRPFGETEYCKEHDTWWILGISSGRVIRKASEAIDCGEN